MTLSQKVYQVDYAVVGSGVAGIRAAIELSQAGSVLVLAKSNLSESATAYAQSGIAVALSDEDEIGLVHDGRGEAPPHELRPRIGQAVAEVVEAELPGVSEKDLKLELKNGLLTLSTEKKEESKEKDEAGMWIRRERRESFFSRSFELPEDADGEKIEARFKDGLLTVELPKKPEASPRIVPVKAA